MPETISTAGVDILPVCLRHLAQQVLRVQGFMNVQTADDATALPPWFSLTLTVMDLWDAYRGCPVREEQRGCAVVAAYSTQDRAWRFFAYT